MRRKPYKPYTPMMKLARLRRENAQLKEQNGQCKIFHASQRFTSGKSYTDQH